MTEVLALALGLAEPILVAGGLVFLRIGAIMALLPAFGERSVPVRVRLALTLLFTVIVAPAVIAEGPPPPEYGAALARAAFGEVTAGLALGILLRLMVVALQIAGTIAANVTSLSQILGGASVDPQPAMAHLMVVAGLALAAMSGLHVQVADAMIRSYDVFPLGGILAAGDLATWGTGRVAAAFSLGFTLAAPFVIISLVYNLALGAINRAMPQLMVAFVGAPAITMTGLILMLLATPFLLALWKTALDGVFQTLGL